VGSIKAKERLERALEYSENAEEVKNPPSP
jgi:hypothetical protein